MYSASVIDTFQIGDKDDQMRPVLDDLRMMVQNIMLWMFSGRFSCSENKFRTRTFGTILSNVRKL